MLVFCWFDGNIFPVAICVDSYHIGHFLATRIYFFLFIFVVSSKSLQPPISPPRAISFELYADKGSFLVRVPSLPPALTCLVLVYSEMYWDFNLNFVGPIWPIPNWLIYFYKVFESYTSIFFNNICSIVCVFLWWYVPVNLFVG